MKPGLAPNKVRGIGLIWGPDCTEDFLKKFQLKVMLIIGVCPAFIVFLNIECDS